MYRYVSLFVMWDTEEKQTFGDKRVIDLVYLLCGYAVKFHC